MKKSWKNAVENKIECSNVFTTLSKKKVFGSKSLEARVRDREKGPGVNPINKIQSKKKSKLVYRALLHLRLKYTIAVTVWGKATSKIL